MGAWGDVAQPRTGLILPVQIRHRVPLRGVVVAEAIDGPADMLADSMAAFERWYAHNSKLCDLVMAEMLHDVRVHDLIRQVYQEWISPFRR